VPYTAGNFDTTSIKNYIASLDEAGIKGAEFINIQKETKNAFVNTLDGVA